MTERIVIAGIIAITLLGMTAMVCDTIDKATSAPKIIRLSFDKGGAIGFQPKGGVE